MFGHRVPGAGGRAARAKVFALSPRRPALVASLALPALALVCGCGKKSSGSTAPHASESASSSAHAAASASGANVFASATAAADAAPVGDGTSTFEPAGDACKPAQAILAEYLQRGDLTIGARDNAIAAAWLVQVPNKPSQIAFGGFDGEARPLARVRGIATAKEGAPTLFPTGSDWTVSWFDDQGLAWARPRWEALPAPEVDHLTAIGASDADDVSLALAKSGSVVAVAPFGAERAQLSLFLFAPVDDSPRVRALGVTHHAKHPRHPAVAATAAGYQLAWADEGGRLATTLFDANGKEIGDGDTLAPPSDDKRDRLTLVPTDKGALALWEEKGVLLARPLDDKAHPSGPPRRVAQGKWSTAMPDKDGALVIFAGPASGSDDPPLELVRVKADGTPGDKGLRIAAATKDPPALADAGARIAIASTESMGTGVATKRAVLRTIAASCVK